MKFANRNGKTESGAARRRSAQGFTLAEVLAAMLFMAIVIPVAIQGLRVASLAGEVADRKSQAARIADRVLNETMASTNVVQTSFSGTIVEGIREFQYRVAVEPWSQYMTNQLPNRAASPGQLMVTQPQVDQLTASQVVLNLVTVEVSYIIQGRDYTFRLNTLASAQ